MFTNLTPYSTVAQSLLKATKTASPFSLIRLGDGENTVLQYPKYCTDGRAEYVFRRALENRIYSSAEILDVREKLLISIENSDVIGIYPSSHPNVLCRVYHEHIQDLRMPVASLYCYPVVHFFLQQAGILAEVIENVDFVTLICGRDVIGAFKDRFQVNAEQILVPSENSYRLDNEIYDLPHYPERFAEVCNLIKRKSDRHLFLVGAGFLGKYYCYLAKKAGAISVDIGSVFDYWSDVPTREGYETVVNGKLALKRPTQRAAMALDSQAIQGEKGIDLGMTGQITRSYAGYVEHFSKERLNLVHENLPLAAMKIWKSFLCIEDLCVLDLNEPIDSNIDFQNRAVAVLGTKKALVGELGARQVAGAVMAAKSVFFEDFRIFHDLPDNCKSGIRLFDLKLTTSTSSGNFAGFFVR